MPLALLAALAGSAFIHAAALFLPDVDLSTAPPEPPLQAEIRLPALPAVEKVPEAVKAPRLPPVARTQPLRRPRTDPVKLAPLPAAAVEIDASSETTDVPLVEMGFLPPQAVRAPDLPVRGRIRYTVFRGDQGFQVGRAEHEWEFSEGRYRIRVMTETSGLAAVFKPVRVEMESRGRFGPHGLQPESLTTWRNGSETRESAVFDWESRQVTVGYNGRRHALEDGAQDVVSFHYQLALLPHLAQGTTMWVATGKKFSQYRFDVLGEEILELPTGLFRTLHVRVRTDSTSEVWLALDHQMLPIRIRHVDRKGESFEQLADALGDLSP